MTTGKGLPYSLANNEQFQATFQFWPKVVLKLEDVVLEATDVSGNPVFYGAMEVPTSAGFTLEWVEVSAPSV